MAEKLMLSLSQTIFQQLNLLGGAGLPWDADEQDIKTN